MLLAIDIGNTNIVFGVIEDGEIRNILRIHTEPRYTAAEYGIQLQQLFRYYEINPAQFEAAIVCSVVPTVTEALREAIRHLTGLGCVVVGPGIKTGINVRIDDPSTLAGDLVVGSVAAIETYGAPVIVLDMDTATTMAVVDERRCYRGGVIAPGVMLGLKALSSGTSLLPEVSLSAPKKVIGTNTADAMRSGAVYAAASMLDGMIERMEEELGYRCRAVATGRFADMVTGFCRKEITYDEDLLLKGLWILYQKNKTLF